MTGLTPTLRVRAAAIFFAAIGAVVMLVGFVNVIAPARDVARARTAVTLFLIVIGGVWALAGHLLMRRRRLAVPFALIALLLPIEGWLRGGSVTAGSLIAVGVGFALLMSVLNELE